MTVNLRFQSSQNPVAQPQVRFNQWKIQSKSKHLMMRAKGLLLIQYANSSNPRHFNASKANPKQMTQKIKKLQGTKRELPILIVNIMYIMRSPIPKNIRQQSTSVKLRSTTLSHLHFTPPSS